MIGKMVQINNQYKEEIGAEYDNQYGVVVNQNTHDNVTAYTITFKSLPDEVFFNNEFTVI